MEKFGERWLKKFGLLDRGPAAGGRGAQGRVPGALEGRQGAGQLDLLAEARQGQQVADVGREGIGKASGAGSGSQGKAESDDGKALK